MYTSGQIVQQPDVAPAVSLVPSIIVSAPAAAASCSISRTSYRPWPRRRCATATISEGSSPERATTTVTPRLREQVFARDHHRCTVPGCRSARNLDIHHIIPQARGGKHELWNVTLLCSGYHTALHNGLLEMHGQAPYDIEFHWVYGPPLPVGLEPEARHALIRERIARIFDPTSASHEIRDPMPGVPAGTQPR